MPAFESDSFVALAAISAGDVEDDDGISSSKVGRPVASMVSDSVSSEVGDCDGVGGLLSNLSDAFVKISIGVGDVDDKELGEAISVLSTESNPT